MKPPAVLAPLAASLRLLRGAAPAQPPPPEAHVLALSGRLEAAAQRRLGRSLSLWPLRLGGCGGCALEFAALSGLPYGLERYGLRLAAVPAQADVLLLLGAPVRALAEAAERALQLMPEPRWVVAVGACAAGRGPFAGGYAVAEAPAVPLDLVVEGCPPEPSVILAGLRALLEAQERRRVHRPPPPPAVPEG